MNDSAGPVIQVAIGTLQPLPNYITASQLKPDVVAMIRTSNDHNVVRHTSRVCEALQSFGIKVHTFPGLPASGYAEIRQFMEGVLHSLYQAHPDARFQLNMTGGTKVMAVAALTVFGSQPDCEVVYLDTHAGQIEYLQPAHRAPLPTSERLDLRPFMKLHGFNVETIASEDPAWCERVTQRSTLTNQIAKTAFAPSGNQTIGIMNRAGIQCGNNLSTFSLSKPARGTLLEILQKSSRIGLIDWDQKLTFRFINEDAASFFAGGWLEEYLWLKLSAHTELNVHCSVKGFWARDENTGSPEGKGYNELDLIVFRGHRFYVIECKTGVLDKTTTQVTEVLAKLAQLAKASGGSLAEALLVSYRPIREGDKARAVEMGVRVYDAENIRLASRFITHPPTPRN